MGSVPALKAAIELLHFPSQAPLIRAGPLPQGITALLHIAAGDEQAVTQAAALEHRSRETVREAATFFLEQVLLHADADSYRVLGAGKDVSHAELRRNMSLLLQWLHPDLDHGDSRSVFAARVTRAWNDLKTPERRAAYDLAQGFNSTKTSSMYVGRHKRAPTTNMHLVRRSIPRGGPYRGYRDWRHHPRPGIVRRILLLLFGRSAF
jgi:hypothetical protein